MVTKNMVEKFLDYDYIFIVCGNVQYALKIDEYDDIGLFGTDIRGKKVYVQYDLIQSISEYRPRK